MNQQQSPTINIERPDVRQGSEMGQHGRWLLIVRVGGMMLTLLLLTLNVVLIPRFDALLQAHCQPGPQCFAIQLTSYDRTLLHQLGLSPGFLAAYQAVVLNGLWVLVYCAVGALIFWRKSADRMALFCAFGLALFGGYTSILQDTLGPLSPAWLLLLDILNALGSTCLTLFIFIFPSGRFVPRWTRWIALCTVPYWIYADVFANTSGSILFWVFWYSVVWVRWSIATGAYPRPESASRPGGSSLASPWASLALGCSLFLRWPYPQHCSNRAWSRRSEEPSELLSCC